MKFESKKGFLKYSLLCVVIFFFAYFTYSHWTPGQDIRDGCHDLGKNGIWIQHGWLGDDRWFIRNKRETKKDYFRNSDQIWRLEELFREHHITDIFPHLCPTLPNGRIPSVDSKQTELFLDILKDFRVMPWVGGVLGTHVFLENPSWRNQFVISVAKLVTAHPRLSGIYINIEP